MKFAPFLGFLSICFSLSSPAQAEILCQSDLHPVGQALVQVRIKDEAKSPTTVEIKADKDFAVNKADAYHFKIRPHAKWKLRSETLNLNPGEAILSFINLYLTDPALNNLSSMKLNFSLDEVAFVKMYHWNQETEKTNVNLNSLIEVYNSHGELLGRFLQGLMISVCQ